MNQYEKEMLDLIGELNTKINALNGSNVKYLEDVKKTYSAAINYNLSYSHCFTSKITTKVSQNLHAANLAIHFAAQVSFFVEESRNPIRFDYDTKLAIWENFKRDADEFHIQENYPALYNNFTVLYNGVKEKSQQYYSSHMPQTEPPRIDETSRMNDLRRKEKQLNRIQTVLEGGIDRDVDERKKRELADMIKENTSVGMDHFGFGGMKGFM